MRARALQLLFILGPLAPCGCEQQQQRAPTPAETTATTATASSSGATAMPTTSASAARVAESCSPSCNSLEQCKAGKCKPACPDGEVYVPATGKDGFTLGAGIRGGKIDAPHRVVLTKPFCMDATEVTVEAYDQCVKADECEKPRLWGMWRNYPTRRKHPVNKVSWKQGKAYCESRKQSLPTEAQWEWAATGGDGRKWAWGNEKPTCELTDYVPAVLRTPSSDDGCNGGGTSEVATHPKGDRIWPDGHIHDLSGNLWEWCLDNYEAWKVVDEVDPLHLNYPEGVHVVRGGGWNRSARGIRTHYRGGAVVNYQVPGLGFRCVRNPAG
jgi:formylglycine-generating enzyme required for sulfatase activity